MKIKKFVISNIILSIVLITTLYGLSWIYINYFYEYSIKFLKLDKDTSITRLKIVNVGTSHTYNGIIYPKKIKGYNLALPSQKFYYDYKILNKYKDRLDKESIVIIPISIFSFYDSLKTENIDKNYASFLNKNEILHMKYNEYFMLKYFSVTQPIKRIPKVLQQINLLLKNKKIVIDETRQLNLEEMKVDSLNKSKNHLKIESTNSELGINQLKNMINFCLTNGYKPILITTPFTNFYNIEIGSENYQERIYKNLKEIEKHYQEKYIYLDYSHDKRFINNLEYFRDSDHLNEKGAEYFTKILLNDLKSKYSID